jgi:hypothetical protein
MTCERFRSEDGTITGFICNRSARRPKCSVCKVRPAMKLCDFPLVGKKQGQTCSVALCEKCAVEVDVANLPEQFRLIDLVPGVVPGGPGDRTMALEPDTVDVCPAHARFIRAKAGKEAVR